MSFDPKIRRYIDTQKSRTIQRPIGKHQNLYQRCTTAGESKHKKKNEKFDQQASLLYVEGEWVHHSKKKTKEDNKRSPFPSNLMSRIGDQDTSDLRTKGSKKRISRSEDHGAIPEECPVVDH